MTVNIVNGENPERQLNLSGKQNVALWFLAIGDAQNRWYAFRTVQQHVAKDYFSVPRQMRASKYASMTLNRKAAFGAIAVLDECASFNMRGAGQLASKVRELYASPTF